MRPSFVTGRARLWLYMAQWALIAALLALLLSAQPDVRWSQALAVALPLATIYAFVCGSAWYVASGLPLGGAGLTRTLATAATAALVSSAFWVVLGGAWVRWLARWWSDAAQPDALQGLRPLVFSLGLLLYLLSLAGSYLLLALERSQAAERRGLEGQVLAREAELRSLRAQIDPHFLFNSLNSISALTTVDAGAARRMCVLLADFLRESLALGGEDRIPLARELHMARRFLEIERVRFGDRLHVDVDEGNAGAVPVAPLLLQPLVENAVTHGVAHVLAGGTIRIRATAGAAWLTIVVENPCDADRPRRTGTGVGLANVRARVRALYGTDARVDASEVDGSWRVELRLPIGAAA
jgi:signal transduction histidine kinase